MLEAPPAAEDRTSHPRAPHAGCGAPGSYTLGCKITLYESFLTPCLRPGCCAALDLGLAQSANPVLTRAQDERQPYLDTLRDLVSIESGSADVEGLNRIADLLAARLRTLGGEVEFVAPPTDMVRFENTPLRTGKSVVGRFRGTGTKRILLLAHMDTVYQKGMLAKQPFRIDGDRAYGLGSRMRSTASPLCCIPSPRSRRLVSAITVRYCIVQRR